MYTHILVAVDGSESAERALPYAEALAGAFGAAVTLLRATPPPGDVLAEAGPVLDPTPVVEEEQHEAAEYLHGLRDRVRWRNPRLIVDCEEVEGPAAEVIVARAGALSAGLIVMAASPPGRLRRFFFGAASVADEVLRHACCQVLLVPADHAGRH